MKNWAIKKWLTLAAKWLGKLKADDVEKIVSVIRDVNRVVFSNGKLKYTSSTIERILAVVSKAYSAAELGELRGYQRAQVVIEIVTKDFMPDKHKWVVQTVVQMLFALARLKRFV